MRALLVLTGRFKCFFKGWCNGLELIYPFSETQGVADQLQTNYASDLRSILKTLFEVMATKPETEDKEKQKKGKRSKLLFYIMNFC